MYSAALEPKREQAGKRYLRYFPEAQTYYDMPDFQFYRIAPQALRYIGGFGDIHWVKADRYQVPANTLATEEDALLKQINTGRTAAQGLVIGIDCDGFDLRLNDRTVRHDFPTPALDAAQALALLQK